MDKSIDQSNGPLTCDVVAKSIELARKNQELLMDAAKMCVENGHLVFSSPHPGQCVRCGAFA
jgi:hypothetical protein